MSNNFPILKIIEKIIYQKFGQRDYDVLSVTFHRNIYGIWELGIILYKLASKPITYE